jgi:alcohol dehydrogenase (cytochrome c)
MANGWRCDLGHRELGPVDLFYWGVGNPSPDLSADVRPGDNLFTDSVIALRAINGKLA